MRIEELLLEVVQRGIVELELPLEGAVGQMWDYANESYPAALN